MNQDKKHFLKISGFIPVSRRAEFEATLRQLFRELPPGCYEHSFSFDIFVANHYHIYSLWKSFDAMKAYLKSPQFTRLQHTYKTLGLLEKVVKGELLDVKCFEVSNIE